MAGPLLAQAATALAAIEHAESEEEAVWGWARRNLSAAAERLLSPAERVERAVEPWSTYFVLPVLAFTATGISLIADFDTPHAAAVFSGIALGFALAKPIGIAGSSWAVAKVGLGMLPADTTAITFLGASFLCGIADPFSLLMADQAFGGSPYASIAKIAVLVGSVLATAMGVTLLALSPPPSSIRAR
jgi:Na+:H+ antiporter, NhaA family